MTDPTPRRALPDAPATDATASDAVGAAHDPGVEQPGLNRFARARKAYGLVSDIVTPQRIGLFLAAVVLLVAGIAGGFDAVTAADERLPTATVGAAVAATPFEITVKRARHGTELRPIAYKAEGRRYVFLTVDVRATDTKPVPAGYLSYAVEIDVPGLSTTGSTVTPPTVYRVGDGLSARSLQPGLTVPVVLTWQADASQPLPDTVTVTLHKQTWRASTLDGVEQWLDPTASHTLTLPLEPLAAN